jgi:hypothetical protein
MKTESWEKVRKITEGSIFSRVGAWVILNKSGEICGTVKILFPADGAGVLKAVIHEHGFEPQMGTSGGYGYDKKSAALSGAKFGDIILEDSGKDWTNQLRDAGFNVYQAV